MVAGFKAAFPEFGAMAPVLTGDIPKNSVLPRMRRSQLVHLAKAYGIANRIPIDGTKKQILPALVAAEQAGEFQKPAVNRYHLYRAGMSPDDIRNMKADGQKIPGENDFPSSEMPMVLPADSMAGLHRRAKELNINSFGMTKAALQAAIATAESTDEMAKAALGQT